MDDSQFFLSCLSTFACIFGGFAVFFGVLWFVVWVGRALLRALFRPR